MAKGTIYLLELKQTDGLVKIKKRSEDYDVVSREFDRLKKTILRELCMYRVNQGEERVLLKTFSRGRAGSGTVVN